MAKRFTDTEKWKKAWFLNLSPKHRDLRQFILDDCDHAGIWELSVKRAGMLLGYQITREDINISFGGKAQFLDDKVFIPDFIEFQYGKLNSANRTHSSVLSRLKKIGILEAPYIAPTQGACIGAKDKDKDTDMDKDKDKEGECEGEWPHPEHEAACVKLAIRKFGAPNALEAKAFLGEKRWAIIKDRLGGWREICLAKSDDFTNSRIQKAFES